MHEAPHQAHSTQAHGNLLVLLFVVMLSLVGLLGAYASEMHVSTQHRGFGKKVGD